jgi:hypothetical protein
MADTLMPEGGDETMGGGATGNDARRRRCGSVPIYWDSPEAAKLFGFCYENGDNVFQGIEKQIVLLAKVLKSNDGYKKIVRDIDKEPLSSTQIFSIRNKRLYLRTAYCIALKKWEKTETHGR